MPPLGVFVAIFANRGYTQEKYSPQEAAPTWAYLSLRDPTVGFATRRSPSHFRSFLSNQPRVQVSFAPLNVCGVYFFFFRARTRAQLRWYPQGSLRQTMFFLMLVRGKRCSSAFHRANSSSVHCWLPVIRSIPWPLLRPTRIENRQAPSWALLQTRVRKTWPSRLASANRRPAILAFDQKASGSFTYLPIYSIPAQSMGKGYPYHIDVLRFASKLKGHVFIITLVHGSYIPRKAPSWALLQTRVRKTWPSRLAFIE